MVRFSTSSYIALCMLGTAVNADQPAGFNADAFAHPASTHRPPFRYWLPDASVAGDIVAKDVVSNSQIGAGGFEFVPFFEYGGELGSMPEGADWSTHGFGTEPFRKLLKFTLEAHESAGLYMDVALGPNQGQGVPADPINEGLQWDLVSRLFYRLLKLDSGLTQALYIRFHTQRKLIDVENSKALSLDGVMENFCP